MSIIAQKTGLSRGGWKRARLGDVMKSPAPSVLKIQTSNYQKEGILPIYDQGSVSVAGYTNEKDARYNGKLPAILFGDHTRTLNCVKTPFALGADGVQILEPDENILDRNYFFYAIKNLNLKSYGYERHLKYLRELEITIPEIGTQKVIARALSTFDSKIENNSRIIKILEEMTQAIFKEWFVKFRFPGHDKSEFVDSELGKIPKGWEVKRIDEVCDVNIGRTPPREQNQWFTKGGSGIKWISIKDMASTPYIFAASEGLTREAVEKFNIPVIPANTLVISFKLTMGRIAITSEVMLSNEAIAHLNLKTSSDLFPEYLWLQMSRINLANYGSTSSIGTAVNSKTVKQVPILKPEMKILLHARKVLEPMFAIIKSKMLENDSLEKTRDFLLPKLMSGKVRV